MDLKKLKAKSLSTKDLMKALPNTKIWAYGQLKKVNELDDLFGKDGSCILLYESKQDYGHWIAMIQRNDKSVEVFDSYGIKPDNQLNYINSYWKIKLGQNYPKLTKLLIDSPNKKFIYNQYRLQKMNKNINTCGRYCITRIRLKELSLDAFVTLLREFAKKLKCTVDDIVTIMTKNI